MTRPAAGGGRWVDVAPERLERWLAGFRDRHGDFAVTATKGAVVLRAFDDAVAELHAPPGAVDTLDALRPRRTGLLLARRAAVAVGIAYGDELEVHKVDTSYVQSRTAAGGWSQQRFARRRENQAKAAAEDAVDIALRVLVPRLAELSCLITGGDRRAVDAILADRRLDRLVAKRSDRFLDVAEPRLATLTQAARAARAVRIRIIDPE
jgi:Actinobacteria/chloroflexi VLRF1 release factor